MTRGFERRLTGEVAMPYFRKVAETQPSRVASQRMAAVRASNTAPEMRLRRALFAKGLRYRCHASDLPGRPDIVFRPKRLALFVHGCFWHQHPGCRSATTPRVNSAYWGPKLRRNLERDNENEAALAELGYAVVVAWECEIKRDAEAAAASIAQVLDSRARASGPNRAPRSRARRPTEPVRTSLVT